MTAIPSAHKCSTRLVIADDHVLVAQGLARLLGETFDDVALVSSGQALGDHVRQHRPDLVITDLSMPDISGLEVMRQLHREGVDIPFVFLTMHGDATMAAEALRAGASAYVLKSVAGEELLRAIREVLAGNTYITPTLGAQVIAVQPTYSASPLTDKQLQVLAMVAAGMRSKQIAHQLGVSVRTVESHKYAIMQVMDVHSTVELIRKAQLSGLATA